MLGVELGAGALAAVQPAPNVTRTMIAARRTATAIGWKVT